MSEPIFLNLGCGGNILTPPWKNHDLEQDGTDITKPLGYADGSVDMILLEHVLEHVSSPQAWYALSEMRRVLKLGGVLRVCCPIIGTHMNRSQVMDLLSGHGHLMGLTEDLMRTLLWSVGFELNKIQRTDRKPIDGHYRTIGCELDSLETCRLEAVK